MMQLKPSLLAASFLFSPVFFGDSALAQMYPDEDVTVGPAAAGLAQPYPGASQQPIHLHMPYHHRVAHATAGGITSAPDATAQQATASDTAAPSTSMSGEATAPAASAPPPAGSSSRHRHGARVAATAPESNSAIPFSFDPDSSPMAASTPAPSDRQTAAPPKPAEGARKAVAMVAPPTAPVVQTMHAASANTGSGDHADLKKRGAILFEKSAPDPSPAQFHGVQLLAGDLNSALESGASRIQIEAYAGAPGDKSSDARRLSLKRALAVRQLLIDDGVPSSRIDVRAMGGIDDNGPADRVDIFVRAG